jgi:hypothetical protein
MSLRVSGRRQSARSLPRVTTASVCRGLSIPKVVRAVGLLASHFTAGAQIINRDDGALSVADPRPIRVRGRSCGLAWSVWKRAHPSSSWRVPDRGRRGRVPNSPVADLAGRSSCLDRSVAGKPQLSVGARGLRPVDVTALRERHPAALECRRTQGGCGAVKSCHLPQHQTPGRELHGGMWDWMGCPEFDDSKGVRRIIRLLRTSRTAGWQITVSDFFHFPQVQARPRSYCGRSEKTVRLAKNLVIVFGCRARPIWRRLRSQ